MVNQQLAQHSNQIQKLIESIDALEAKQAFQDDIIEQLNSEIAAHQKYIFELQQQLKLLAGRVKDIKGNSVVDSADETPPPHY
jgi:SlyX protein